MGRGRGRPRYKGHSRHFTSRDELEQERKKDEEKERKRLERGEDASTEESSSEEESGSEESGSEDDKEKKPKGVEALIEISNPNIARKGQVKVEKVAGQVSQLTRRQKEELAKQNYQRLQMECKTDQAQKDLARLAIIRKQREAAAGSSSEPPK